MRTTLSTKYVVLPKGVTCEVTSREVKITGPRGELQRSFKFRNLEITKVGKARIRVDLWFGDRAELACVRTVCTHIKNMVVGVTKGFIYKLRFAYAHFPISVTVAGPKEDQRVEVRNFLGEKRVRVIDMSPGTVAVRAEDQKDQLELVGNDIELVSNDAARIHQSCLVKNKDIRKFLDGIYVSEKGPVGKCKPI